MKRKSQFILHIGFPKTGSTFLQEEVFPALPEINLRVTPNYNIIESKRATSLSRFMNVSPLVWNDLGSLFWIKVREGSATDEDILLSDEYAVEGNDPVRTARHIQELHQLVSASHSLNVLMVIRRQDTWLASVYSQLSNRYSSASQSHFEEWVAERIELNKKFFDSQGLRATYFTLFAAIRDAVGQGSVTVLPYELLKTNPKSFVEKCCSSANRSVPESLSFKQTNKRSTSSTRWAIRPRADYYIQLRPGRVFQTILGRSRIPIPDWRREKEITLNENLSSLILERYKSENKKLDQDLNLGLKEYGYY